MSSLLLHIVHQYSEPIRKTPLEPGKSPEENLARNLLNLLFLNGFPLFFCFFPQTKPKTTRDDPTTVIDEFRSLYYRQREKQTEQNRELSGALCFFSFLVPDRTHRRRTASLCRTARHRCSAFFL